MIRFQHVEYLWLLLLVPFLVVLYLYFLGWRKAKLNKLAEPAFIPHLIRGKIGGRSTSKLVLYCLALICSILGLANLQAGGHTEKTQRKGIDVIFALDVSKSMLAKDINPDRLSRAKELVYRMVDKMRNDRTGLVIFAGNAYLQVPLTIDYGAMKMLLHAVTPDMVPSQGTVLSDAIKLAQKSFSSKEKKHKVIILISDGEDHDEQAQSAAREAAGNGIIIYTVGVGSPQGSTIFDPSTGQNKVDRNGQVVITKLNEQELKELANITGGSYQLLNNANHIAENLATGIDQMESKNLGAVVYTDYKSYFQYFLGAALLFILAGWLLPDAKRISRINSEKGTVTKIAILLTLLSINLPARSLFAQEKAGPEPRKELKAGNRSYEQKEYKEAVQSYMQALQKKPGSFTGNYNLGDALYQTDQNEASRQALQKSLLSTSDKTQQAQAFHNIGNTYLKEKKWEEAIEAFKQALKRNPKDMDTKYNLAYARAMMRKEEQNKKKDNNKKDQNKDQQKKQDQENKDQQDKNKQDQQKKEQQDKKDQEQQHPQSQPSKLTKQQADNILNALSQEEKKLHDEKEKGRAVPVQQEKDW